MGLRDQAVGSSGMAFAPFLRPAILNAQIARGAGVACFRDLEINIDFGMAIGRRGTPQATTRGLQGRWRGR